MSKCLLFTKDRCKTVGTKRQTLSESQTLMFFDKKTCNSCQFLLENKLVKKFSLLRTRLSPFEC